MKKIILIFAAIVVLFTACDKGCKIKRPKDVKPIDWENYNEVYDVVRNYTDTKVSSDMGKTIKICGWIFQGPEGYYQLDPTNFRLCDNEKNIFDHNPYENGTAIYVKVPYHPDINYESFIDSLNIKFATVDITKKCYITGTLSYFGTPNNNCYWINPKILITNANDISFK